MYVPWAWLITEYGEPSDCGRVGQGPIHGDHGRELHHFHLRGVRRRLLCGRGRLLRSGHDDHAGGGDDGNQDGRSGQHPRLPHHRPPVTPAAAAKSRHFCVAAWNPGSLRGSFPAMDGIRVVSMRGPSAVGSGKSGTPLSRMHWANLRAVRIRSPGVASSLSRTQTPMPFALARSIISVLIPINRPSMPTRRLASSKPEARSPCQSWRRCLMIHAIRCN